MKTWAKVLAFFETIDAWVVKHPRGACCAGCLFGMTLGWLLAAG